MNAYALTVLLSPPDRPDCRVVESGYDEIRADYFLSRAAYRLVNCVERFIQTDDS